MSTKRRATLFENIIRLRRAEAECNSPEISEVRESLESELGPTVSRHLAARLLGMSHTGFNRWVESGDIPVVITPEGRKQVPISALFELHEKIDEERRSGRRSLHTLEPAIVEARGRARRMRPKTVLNDEPEPRDRHRVSELRGLAYHRAIARRLRRRDVDEAARRIRDWKREGKIDPRYAEAWEDLLQRPVAEIRKEITADTPQAHDLRQNTPFAGLLSEPERRRIIEQVH